MHGLCENKVLIALQSRSLWGRKIGASNASGARLTAGHRFRGVELTGRKGGRLYGTRVN